MTLPWSERIFLIAEAGVNHNGDIDKALRMVELAAESGADAIKFQTFRSEELAVPRAPKAEYQQRTTGTADSQLSMLKALELTEEEHGKLREHAATLGVGFFSTAFDFPSIDFLRRSGQTLWKVPSGEITDFPYLAAIGALHLPTIVSTGMATLAEVAAAIDVLLAQGLQREQLCVLHCNTEYPTPWADVNLRAMPRMGAALGCAYGYSDHTPGVEVSVAAAALGARVIEKHFTLDKSLPGPDHEASMAPEELKAWVAEIRHVEIAMGDGVKRPTGSEAKNRAVARKVIVARRAISAGEAFSAENLTVKRAGEGLSPMAWPQLLGKLSTRAYRPDETIDR